MPSSPPTALTIGNFDGVHRGHRSLVEAVTRWRREHSAKAKEQIRTAVLTFEPHPVEILRKIHVPRLTSMAEKTRLLQSLGIDDVRVLPFTAEFSRCSAREFFERYVRTEMSARFVAVGHNFYFGHDRTGTPGKMVDWCQEAGIACELVPPVEADGEPVSSSRIRKLLQEGHTVSAARLLGRDYALHGEIVHGDKRGRQIGFPTANMLPATEGLGAPCLPARGVYLSVCTVEDKTFPAVTNVGIKPTVTKQGLLVVESHLLDFEGDLYGKQMTVEFRDRLRDEHKFAGIAELTKQIQLDVQKARALLENG